MQGKPLPMEEDNLIEKAACKVNTMRNKQEISQGDQYAIKANKVIGNVESLRTNKVSG